MTDWVCGSFVHVSGATVLYRAERQADGTLWRVDMVTEVGNCFDTIVLPGMRTAYARCQTDDGAHAVIREALDDHYKTRG